MIDFIIIYDHLDDVLGTYFESCKLMLEDFLSSLPFTRTTEFLNGHLTTQMSVDHKIATLGDVNFIFVAYSHGSSDGQALLCRNEAYVLKNVNTNAFFKSIVYTNACYAGRELGPDLEAHGCQAFIGNKEPVEALLGKYRGESIKIDNYGLILFLGTSKTIHECFLATKLYYNTIIDRLSDIDFDIGSAAVLTYNRDALVFYGNKDLRKEDLFN